MRPKQAIVQVTKAVECSGSEDSQGDVELSDEEENVLPANLGTESETPLCRICLTEEESDLDPLLQPCKCAGSAAFIHH